MNKDMIGEICKYLDRDVYMVHYYRWEHDNNCYENSEPYLSFFYSYDSAYQEARNLVIKTLVDDIGECIDNEFDIIVELLENKINSSQKKRIKKLLKDCEYEKGYDDNYRIEAYKTVLNKTMKEMIEFSGIVDISIDRKNIEGENEYDNRLTTIKIKKITINP